MIQVQGNVWEWQIDKIQPWFVKCLSYQIFQNEHIFAPFVVVALGCAAKMQPFLWFPTPFLSVLSLCAE